jgi:peptide/nickel transport system permease protein
MNDVVNQQRVDNGRTAGGSPAARLRRHEWLAVLGAAARSARGMIGLSLALLVVAVAVIGPLVAPHSATEFVSSTFALPSSHFPLGTDVLGRDVLSRVFYGGWLLLIVAAAATMLGVAVGALAGIMAAYYRGWRDGLIMRIVDVILAFPAIVFALLLVSIAGPKLWLVVVAVAATHAPQVARVMRAAALDICEKDFVKAIELIRVPSRKIIRGEILPNLVTPLMVETGLRMTWSIVIISGLSFIGFGLQPPAPNWGLMLNENRIGLVSNPWSVIVPALLIALLTIGLNTFTDAVARVSIGVERPVDQQQLLEEHLLGQSRETAP